MKNEQITEKKVAELEKGCGLIVGGFDLGNEICGTAYNFESKFFCYKCKEKAKEMIERLGCGRKFWSGKPCINKILCNDCQKLKERLEAIK